MMCAMISVISIHVVLFAIHAHVLVHSMYI